MWISMGDFIYVMVLAPPVLTDYMFLTTVFSGLFCVIIYLREAMVCDYGSINNINSNTVICSNKLIYILERERKVLLPSVIMNI